MSLPVIPVSIKSIAADLLTKHPELHRHMAKAIDLLSGDRIRFSHHTTEGQPVYLVRASDGASVYVVEAGECTCPARKLCYHRVARGLLVIRSANLTRVAFDEAISAEEEPPTPPSEHPSPAPSEGETSKFDQQPNIPSASKCVQSAGRLAKGLSIRESMDGLGRRLREVRILLTTAKAH